MQVSHVLVAIGCDEDVRPPEALPNLGTNDLGFPIPCHLNIMNSSLFTKVSDNASNAFFSLRPLCGKIKSQPEFGYVCADLNPNRILVIQDYFQMVFACVVGD